MIAMVYLLVALVGLATLAGFYRLLKGPTRVDRVVALDLLFALAVVLSISAALASGRTVFLDVAIGLSLVGFVASLAWARLIERQATDDREASP